MTLITKDGVPKRVPHCTYPLTSLACVSRVYTELATLTVGVGGIRVGNTYGGSVAELRKRLAAPIKRLED